MAIIHSNLPRGGRACSKAHRHLQKIPSTPMGPQISPWKETLPRYDVG